ncbi:MAG: OmpA family protein, partial [Bacteroidota bacterium]
QEIKSLFRSHIPSDRFLLQSMLIEKPKGLEGQPFEAAEFYWVDSGKPVAASSNSDNATIVSLDDKVLIYFPFNSAESELDESITDYLDDLATRIIANEEQVLLTGHTDNIGSYKSNYALGLARARRIAQILLQKGVSSDYIKVQSKGETEPMVANNSEANRQKNRRTVVSIIP